MTSSYLTSDHVNYILNKFYSQKVMFSEDRFVLKDTTSFTLAYIKYILYNYDWNWDEISYDISTKLLLKNVQNIFIRLDYDILLQEGDKNSFYIYKGHSGHLVTNPHLIASHFKVLKHVSQSTIKEYCVEETNNKTITFPDSAHLIIKKILSTNISIIY